MSKDHVILKNEWSTVALVKPLMMRTMTAGEAYDKAARLLGLDLRPNGGAALEQLALSGDAQRYKFSVPLKKYQNCNYSYAGLKTAVRLAIEAELPEGPIDANLQVLSSPFISKHVSLNAEQNALATNIREGHGYERRLHLHEKTSWGACCQTDLVDFHRFDYTYSIVMGKG